LFSIFCAYGQEESDQEESGQEESEQEESDQEESGQEESEQEEYEQEEADQEEADQEESDQEEADQEESDQEEVDQVNVAKLQKDATRLRVTIKKIEKYISYLVKTYSINTSVAQKVVRTVWEKSGHLSQNVGSIGSACYSVVTGNPFALIGLSVGMWELGKTCLEIYKDLKKWIKERRIPKKAIRNAEPILCKLKKELRQLEEQTEELQSSDSEISDEDVA
jgi:chemotaxis protein histidine kinase CheA